ncbi:MAG: hypothetical protein ACRENB_10890 [Gemmatimonadales bacterium]
MISYELYKVIHLTGVVAVIAALGGVAVHAINGGTRESNAARRFVAVLHGLGLLVVLVAGFGLLARLDLMTGGLPLWVYGKLAVWVLAVILLVLPYRRPSLARGTLLLGLPLLGLLAAWLAVYKPV